MKSAAACCLYLALLALPLAGRAQAVVGYQEQTTATWNASVSSELSIREQLRTGVQGTNVQPLGGADSFTLRSQWELREQGKPFQLTITDINPSITVDQSSGQVYAASVQRSANLLAAPSGRIGELIPYVELLPSITLSVFTDP
jgi:hypothetical protein